MDLQQTQNSLKLQSIFHPCINQKPQYWLPPYKKEKKL